MIYCTNCGIEISSSAKFCPNCGAKIIHSSERKKPKMQKGIVKSYERKEIQQIGNIVCDNVNNEIKNSFLESISTEKSIKKEKEITSKAKRPFKKIMLFYILLNIPIVILNYGDELLTGILIFSFFVLIIYLIRKNNTQPFNWFLIIFLVLQILLLIPAMLEFADYFENPYSAFMTILLLIFILVNLKLIFTGNKN